MKLEPNSNKFNKLHSILFKCHSIYSNFTQKSANSRVNLATSGRCKHRSRRAWHLDKYHPDQILVTSGIWTKILANSTECLSKVTNMLVRLAQLIVCQDGICQDGKPPVWTIAPSRWGTRWCKRSKSASNDQSLASKATCSAIGSWNVKRVQQIL